MGTSRGTDRLQPRVVDRLQQLLRPEWAQSTRVRRVAAGLLVVAAAVIAMADSGDGDTVEVLTAGHDLAAGAAISPGDLEVRRLPAEAVPGGAVGATVDLSDRAVSGPVGVGEVITETRLRSAALPQQLTGREDARLVPVRPADDSVGGLLAYGDVVDVVDERAEVLARDAVVAVPAEAGERSLTAADGGRPVLLAMSESAAHRVAAAGLGAPITIVLH